MDDETRKSQRTVQILVAFSFSVAVIIAGCFYYYKNTVDKRFAAMAKVIIDASLNQVKSGNSCPDVPTLYSMGDRNPALRIAVFSNQAPISVNCQDNTVSFRYTDPPKTFKCRDGTCKAIQ